MVSVRVPATTANLGPGFDCLGLALNLYARFTFEETESGLTITGDDPAYRNETNLAYQAYQTALRVFGQRSLGLKLHVDCAIPMARGLGSSAAFTVAGIMAASKLRGMPLPLEDVYALTAQIEGHPDNAAPAVFGGLRISLVNEDRPLSLPAAIHDSLRLLALIPDFDLMTRDARMVLPKQVPLTDAVFNLSRTAFMLKALESGDEDSLRVACQDRLHQPQRYKLIPGGAHLAQRMEALGAIRCFLSGAGPTLMCLYKAPAFETLARGVLSQEFPRFSALPLSVCRQGAIVAED